MRFLVIKVFILVINLNFYSCVTSRSQALISNQPARSEWQGKFLPIEKIKQEKGKEVYYLTEGYVIRKTVCPPCPPKAQCAPCMPDNILVSEDKDFRGQKLTEREMQFFTPQAKDFEIGQVYYFSIKLYPKQQQPNDSIDYADLLFFERR